MEDFKMKRIILLVVIMAFLSVPLAVGGARDVSLPAWSELTLKNGFKVFVVETDEVPMVTLRMLVPAGSAYDI